MIRPLLLWFFPGASNEKIEWGNALIRKAAHLTVYAGFALLIARALIGCAGPRLRRRWFVISLSLLVLLAMADEYHQSFVPTRHASIRDVLLDSGGGLLVLVPLWLWRWRSAQNLIQNKSRRNS